MIVPVGFGRRLGSGAAWLNVRSFIHILTELSIKFRGAPRLPCVKPGLLYLFFDPLRAL
ncbi:MAG: hypothetical protein H6897_12275 [Rhodobacteraceae bacterium]|uniref:hypothetical protein n=1 Tax=Albidovulum sp. TaxID=1872424 RepID=UPI001DF68647|nr:hypothetical protein [uncultured Defluviimonas sp.]MCB2125256.1 hypothetical protein [Paracoccaceae bacterium]MCC0070692.1 hypothetical protein [Paracoccaceae bacterium]